MSRLGAGNLSACILTVCLASIAAADEAAPPLAEAVGAQDVLLLGPQRPIMVRLLISLEGNPLRSAWLDRFERLATAGDADQDGTLKIADAITLSDQMSGQLDFTPSARQFQAELEKIAGSAGTISKDELRSFLLRKFPPFRLASGLAEGGGAAPALFPLLDANSDGRLSAEELAGAPDYLVGRDFDDDQVLTEPELAAVPPEVDQSQQAAASDSGELLVQSGIVVIVSPGAGAQVARILMQRYDRNRDGLLDLASEHVELPSAARNFGKLDADHDKKLSSAELAQLAQLEPDIELAFAFGRDARPPAATRRNRGNSEFRIRSKLTGGYKMQLGELDIDLRRNNRNLSLNSPRELDFPQFDGDNNGYLDQAECRGRLSFATADGDHDKKVSPEEFRAFIDDQSAAANSRTVLQVFDRGQDLYSMLDDNGDGVLTPRELLDAKSLVARADGDGDGMLTIGEIPQRLQLDLSRDGLTTPVVFQQRPPRQRPAQPKAKAAGPRWFQKMDHNQDGDVSRTEFLGPAEAFGRVDSDGDGLISAAEAEKLK